MTRSLVMLVFRNVFHVLSSLQSVVCLFTFFWLIRSLIDPTLAAFIVCGPLQFFFPKMKDRVSKERLGTNHVFLKSTRMNPPQNFRNNMSQTDSDTVKGSQTSPLRAATLGTGESGRFREVTHMVM